MNKRKGKYLIDFEDYIRHIDEKLYLYAMVRKLSLIIQELPDNRKTRRLKNLTEYYAPQLKELWESWCINSRYFVCPEQSFIEKQLDDELMEPEDAGYYCEGSDIRVGRGSVADHELLLSLTDTADKLYDNYAALIELARQQLRRCEQ